MHKQADLKTSYITAHDNHLFLTVKCLHSYRSPFKITFDDGAALIMQKFSYIPRSKCVGLP